jgi:hypothetical protein
MKTIKIILPVLCILIPLYVYALDAGKIYNESIESVVTVVSLDKNDKILMTGTGFFASHQYLIATNYHVIKNAHHIKIITSDNKEHDIFDVCVKNATNDIAVLRSKTKQRPLPLRKNIPQVGDEIISIGSPMGLSGSLSTGIIGAIRNDDVKDYYQITSPISPGSSGGPVIDKNGRVLGMTTFYIKGGQNLNFAIPSTQVTPYLDNSSACSNKTDIKPSASLIIKYSDTLYENYLKNKDAFPSSKQNITKVAYSCIAKLIGDFGTEEEIYSLIDMIENNNKSLNITISSYRKNIIKSLINDIGSKKCLQSK